MKLEKRNITVLGGDKRSLILAKMLVEDNANVTLYGFDDMKDTRRFNNASSLKDAIDASNIIIGPLPFADTDKKLRTPLFSGKIYFEDIVKHMNKDQILFGGGIIQEWLDIASYHQIMVIDYFTREELQVLNAIPTAEGAIQLAMEKTQITIHGSNVMVLGFGRIGKTVAKMLDGIGANVFVMARKHEHIAWIKSSGFKPIFLSDMEAYLPKMDVIMNTVPAILLNRTALEKTNENAVIIDLASNPGGVDFKSASEFGIETVWALGLPGIVAPISAASCIKETITHIIFELEV